MRDEVLNGMTSDKTRIVGLTRKFLFPYNMVRRLGFGVHREVKSVSFTVLGMLPMVPRCTRPEGNGEIETEVDER